MKKELVLLALAGATLSASAAEGDKTYLCLLDAAAMAYHQGGIGGASLVRHEPHRFLLSRASGKWTVTLHGEKNALFDDCTTEYFCEHSVGYAGVFIREENNRFRVTWMTAGAKGLERQMIVGAGRCTAISG